VTIPTPASIPVPWKSATVWTPTVTIFNLPRTWMLTATC
jgi:hypothetical protein